MRPLATSTVLLLALAASPAEAQLSNRSIAVESGLSTPLGAASGTGGALALSASAWLDGDLEAVARASFASAAGTPGRGASSAVSGTVGLRLSLGHAPLRPQVSADVGWTRSLRSSAPADRIAFGLGAALEVFVVRDVSVAVRTTLRGSGGELALEAVIAAAAYF